MIAKIYLGDDNNKPHININGKTYHSFKMFLYILKKWKRVGSKYSDCQTFTS